MGFPYCAKTPIGGLYSETFTNSGLLTISRFPIVAQEFKKYDFNLNDDFMAKKGILYTKILV